VAGQQRAHRGERRVAVGRNAGEQFVPVEQLHVEVAGGAGDRLDPLERRALAGQLVGRERPLQLAQDGAAAADRDPEVVEELGVVVGQRAGQVGFDHAGEVTQHPHGRLVGAVVGPQRHADLGADAAGVAPRRGHRLVGHGGRRLDEARLAREHPHDPRQWARVAEHARHLEPGRERPRLGPGVERRVRGQSHPHDRLGVGVEDPESLDVDLHAGEREQGPHLDDRPEPVAQGALRQVTRQPAAMAARWAGHSRRPGPVTQHEDVAGAPSLERQIEARGAEAAVGGVDDRVRHRRRGVGRDVEPLAEV
jgi:hypothetical protein